MASPLFDFMADLAKDPKKLSDFKENPGPVMDQYNLTQVQKDHILSLKDENMQHDMHKIIGDEMHAQFKDGVRIVC